MSNRLASSSTVTSLTERDTYTDRHPPYSEDAEQAVLAAMMMDTDAIMRAAEVLDDTMFYREGHRRIFRAMIAITERGAVVDPLTLADELDRRGELAASGGKDYIGFLVDAVPTAANVEYHSRIVREKSLLRKLIEVSTGIVSSAFDARTTAAEMLDDAEHKILQLSQQRGGADFVRLKELMWPAMERIEALQKGGKTITGVPSGFNDLDELTSGFQPSDLVILAARPSMGKCLAAGAEIVLDDGRVETIESICRNRRGRLLTLDAGLKLRTTEPSAFIDDGHKPVFRVTTRLGRRVTTTITHPFLAFSGWTRLGELRVGDRIAVPRVVPVFGTEAIRSCEVKLLAYLIGDGGLTDGSPTFTNSNPRLLDEFIDAVAEFGGVVARRESNGGRAPSLRVQRDKQDRAAQRAAFATQLSSALAGRGTRRTLALGVGVSPASVTNWASGATVPDAATLERVGVALDLDMASLAPAGATALRVNVPNPLTRWVADHGLWGKGAREKIVPPAVFTLPREQMALFLNRLFATDGWACVFATGQPQIGYGTSSERLARQVQHLLLRFGIVAAVRRRMSRYRGEPRESWQVDVTDRHAIETFATEIGIFGKESALHRAVESARAKPYRTARDLIPVDVWDGVMAAVGGEPWTSVARRSGIDASAHRPGRRGVTRDRLGRIAEAIDSSALRALADSDVYWDEIVSIESLGAQQVYDLTVPETHNFVADDICVHNTALCLNIAQHAAIDHRVPVAFFSLEMSKESLVQRLLTAEAMVDAQRLRKGMLRDEDYGRLARAAGFLNTAPIFIDDTAGLSLMEMRSKARRLKVDSGLGMIIVDYLQLIHGPNAENRQQEISNISRSLKALAKELAVPVVALSQLSRAPEQRTGEGKRPQLSDLRESGAIEQDADLVMFIYRPEVYEGPQDKDGNSLEGRAEIIIGKQRNGPIGTVNLYFHKHFTRFESMSNRGGPPPAPGPDRS
jgi:replicative DNA helicase